MPGIRLLIKPVSSACNLRCGYCFYRDIADDARKETYRKKHEHSRSLPFRKIRADAFLFSYHKDGLCYKISEKRWRVNHAC